MSSGSLAADRRRAKRDWRIHLGRWSLALCLALGGAGCEREGGLNYPSVVANGPTENCPQNAVTQAGPGGYPTHDALRCSYSDAQGKGETKVRGSVYGEQPGTFPGQPLEGVTVTVHELESDQRPGKQLGKAHTDAQGHFTLAAMLPANTYVVVARDEGGLELARSTLVSDDRNPNIPRIQLLVPMDPELREAMRARARGEAAPTPESEPATQTDPDLEGRQPGLPPAEALPLGVPPRGEGADNSP